MIFAEGDKVYLTDKHGKYRSQFYNKLLEIKRLFRIEEPSVAQARVHLSAYDFEYVYIQHLRPAITPKLEDVL